MAAVFFASSFAALAQTPESVVQSGLSKDRQLAESDIHVSIENGIATLSGHADCLAKTERAAARVIASSEVRAVVNQIEIPAVDDKRISNDARAALRNQQLVGVDHIKLAVNGQRASLHGSVGTLDERDLAREIVSAVPGVAAVENQLDVTYEGIRTDAQIAAQLQFMIKDDPLCDGLALTVQVKDGEVKLGGAVGSREEFDRLVRRSYVTGVTDVQISGLNLDPTKTIPDVEDKEYSKVQSLAALQDALASDPRLDPKTIRVAYVEGALTLSGNVATPKARDAAEATARGIPGVLTVANKLQVGQSLTENSGRAFAAVPPVKPR